MAAGWSGGHDRAGWAPGPGSQEREFLVEHKKDLIGLPWRVAFALQDDGWWVRSEVIWHKPNAHPESVADRPTKAHETVFLLSRDQDYYYDVAAVRAEHHVLGLLVVWWRPAEARQPL